MSLFQLVAILNSIYLSTKYDLYRPPALSLSSLHIPIYHCFLLPLTHVWYSGLEEVVIMAHPRKSEEDKYKKMSISFEPEQLKQLISYCEREERTASWVIRKALSEWLEKHDS